MLSNIGRQAFSGSFKYKEGSRRETLGKLSFLEQCFVEQGLVQLEKTISNDAPEDREYEISLKTDIDIKHIASRKNEERYLRAKTFAVDVFDKAADKHYEDDVLTHLCEDSLELNRSTNVWIYRRDEPVNVTTRAEMLRAFGSIIDKIKKGFEE